MHAAYIIGLIALLGTSAFFGVSENQYRDLDYHSKFQTWQSRFNQYYQSHEEEVYRLGVYIQNHAKILMLNAENTGAVFGETKFMDLTEDEFKQHYLTLHVSDRNNQMHMTRASFNTEIDWTTKGAV